MTGKDEQAMRTYWDERARLNAVWYVDTSLSFDAPDLERFWETGRRIVTEALEGSPAKPPATELAVEIGSGLGRVCRALAERFDRVVGIDISSEMVQRARDLVDDRRIAFEVGDGATLASVETGSADLVLSFTVFQHIPSTTVIENYIAEAGRALKPGGLFVFQWNNTPGARRWAVRRTLLDLAQRVGVTERYGRNAREFLGSRVPLARIRRALERGGMELVSTTGLDTLFAWCWAVRKDGR
jgi:SAM-dependent methyltransferase